MAASQSSPLAAAAGSADNGSTSRSGSVPKTKRPAAGAAQRLAARGAAAAYSQHGGLARVVLVNSVAARWSRSASRAGALAQLGLVGGLLLALLSLTPPPSSAWSATCCLRSSASAALHAGRARPAAAVLEAFELGLPGGCSRRRLSSAYSAAAAAFELGPLGGLAAVCSRFSPASLVCNSYLFAAFSRSSILPLVGRTAAEPHLFLLFVLNLPARPHQLLLRRPCASLPPQLRPPCIQLLQARLAVALCLSFSRFRRVSASAAATARAASSVDLARWSRVLALPTPAAVPCPRLPPVSALAALPATACALAAMWASSGAPPSAAVAARRHAVVCAAASRPGGRWCAEGCAAAHTAAPRPHWPLAGRTPPPTPRTHSALPQRGQQPVARLRPSAR